MDASDAGGLRDGQQGRLSLAASLGKPPGDDVRQPIESGRRQLVEGLGIQRHGRPGGNHVDWMLFGHHAASSPNDSCRGPSQASMTSLHRNTTTPSR